MRLRNRQGGFSLLELSMVMGVIAVMAVTAVMFMNSVSEGRKSMETARNIATITTNIRNQFATQGDYVDINNQVVAGGTNFPRQMLGGAADEIDHFWAEDAVTITQQNIDFAGSRFRITLADIPQSACIDIITKLYADYLVTRVENQVINGAADAGDECDGVVDISFEGS